jgi:hypothetical protein
MWTKQLVSSAHRSFVAKKYLAEHKTMTKKHAPHSQDLQRLANAEEVTAKATRALTEISKNDSESFTNIGRSLSDQNELL